MSKSTQSTAKATGTSAATALPDVQSEIVEIRLGESVSLSVHKNVLLQSPFFVKALKPEWASMHEGKPIDLTDENPIIFKAYVQWLYSHHIDTTHDTIKWAHMYVLGERLMDLEFQDLVLETMARECSKRREYPTFGGPIDIIYNGTLAGSPARKLLVDFYCCAGGSTWVEDEDYASEAPAEFVNDLIRGLMANKKKGKGEYPWEADRAAYFVGSRKTNTH